MKVSAVLQYTAVNTNKNKLMSTNGLNCLLKLYIKQPEEHTAYLDWANIILVLKNEHFKFKSIA